MKIVIDYTTMAEYFLNNNTTFPWGRVSSTDDNKDRIGRFEKLIETFHYTSKDDANYFWDVFVEYLKFVRSEFVTLAHMSVVVRSWEPLWTDFAEYALYNLLLNEKKLSRKDMSKLIVWCCQYAYQNVTDLSPLDLFCRIFTCHDPDFVWVPCSESSLLRGLKNAQHALIEGQIRRKKKHSVQQPVCV